MIESQTELCSAISTLMGLAKTNLENVFTAPFCFEVRPHQVDTYYIPGTICFDGLKLGSQSSFCAGMRARFHLQCEIEKNQKTFC